LQRRTRNLVCIWIIVAGLANFLAYTVVYAAIGGDAKNGYIETVTDDNGNIVTDADGTPQRIYYIKGHFIRSGRVGQRSDVPRWVWIYSYLHSISLWPAQGALMICMLILAQPHIIATMRESSWLKGPAFISVTITLVAVFNVAMSVWFVIGFISEL